MNTNRLKALLWIASLATLGYIVFFVYDFYREQNAPGAREISAERQKAVLGDAAVGKSEAPKSGLVDYARVKHAFHDMNWTGKVDRPVVVETTGEEAPTTPSAKPVAELLQILYVQVDSDAPEGSRAIARFTDGQLIAAATREREREVLRRGDRLAAPYDHISVEAITVDGVLFTFDEEGREPELVETLPNPETSSIVKVAGGSAAVLPPRESLISQSQNPVVWNPRETQPIGRNQFRIGTDDIATMESNYSRILSQDVRYKQRRNPRTGAVEGLEVTFVAGGSIPERAGLAKGEVIKSINGHPVTSLNGAIAYVKKEADTTSTWVVVIERQGREYTRTYESPQE